VRLEASELRREVEAGATSPAEALFDDRAASLTVMGLLTSQYRWGEWRARRLLARVLDDTELLTLPERKRIRDLSDRQREHLAAALREVAA
jgi:hypothetical protein